MRMTCRLSLSLVILLSVVTGVSRADSVRTLDGKIIDGLVKIDPKGGLIVSPRTAQPPAARGFQSAPSRAARFDRPGERRERGRQLGRLGHRRDQPAGLEQARQRNADRGSRRHGHQGRGRLVPAGVANAHRQWGDRRPPDGEHAVQAVDAGGHHAAVVGPIRTRRRRQS